MSRVDYSSLAKTRITEEKQSRTGGRRESADNRASEATPSGHAVTYRWPPPTRGREVKFQASANEPQRMFGTFDYDSASIQINLPSEQTFARDDTVGWLNRYWRETSVLMLGSSSAGALFGRDSGL